MKEGGGRSKHGTMSPCAACKLLRRRCAHDCVFAPYFPADEPQKFASVHKVFGASNVNKMLQELPEHQRSDAVSSMVYEANARVRDPVYGCVGAISSLQHQVDLLQTQLAIAQAEVVHMRSLSHFSSSSSPPPPTTTLTVPSTSSPDHHHSNFNTSPSSSSRLSAKSFFAMDVGESLWSC
ncbi:LOB domain-containing protein 4 [Prosopis cineraria]|uniref:LOB domain-containing protein 4 n=1 Tax=Prosopis cineraria TaxID=364024 RepID=UPI00240FE7D6|nr:LOB domain-containing protein 4 [Prosopis cineraria]XP_054814789.1 LOB domain-containing protein 4 [Prosopis cineraria]XP_054814790.1 LOB domain-containing protein 4 [Prosopis cineraria]